MSNTTKPAMAYAYEVIAGSRSRPQGWIGTYKTKAEALANRPARYASYIKRVKV